MFKYNKLGRKAKLRIYKSLVRPVVTYAIETLILINNEEDKFKIVERQ